MKLRIASSSSSAVSLRTYPWSSEERGPCVTQAGPRGALSGVASPLVHRLLARPRRPASRVRPALESECALFPSGWMGAALLLQRSILRRSTPREVVGAPLPRGGEVRRVPLHSLSGSVHQPPSRRRKRLGARAAIRFGSVGSAYSQDRTNKACVKIGHSQCLRPRSLRLSSSRFVRTSGRGAQESVWP